MAEPREVNDDARVVVRQDAERFVSDGRGLCYLLIELSHLLRLARHGLRHLSTLFITRKVLRSTTVRLLHLKHLLLHAVSQSHHGRSETRSGRPWGTHFVG